MAAIVPIKGDAKEMWRLLALLLLARDGESSAGSLGVTFLWCVERAVSFSIRGENCKRSWFGMPQSG